MIKKKLFAWFTMLVLFIASMGTIVMVSAEENVASARKFNVVFVVDASGSIVGSDEHQWRFEAIDEFLSLLSMQGNYVGQVVFNGDVISSSGVTAINSKDDKKAISDAVKSASPSGLTNIGDALVKANELIENGDKDLPSVILLLSDGNTEMNTDNELNRSLDAQEKAISTARNNNTQIYCVGLNANGFMKTGELSNIATQTNGVFKVVEKSEDLADVFKEFYKLIYGTGGFSIDDEELPLVENFDVPKIGVEEVNILIEGQPSSIQLTKPSGVDLSSSELNPMMSKGNYFTNIKIEKPLSGKWKLELDGQPGQTVTINFVPNLNVSLVTDAGGAESYKRGEPINLETKIISDGKEINDDSIYQEYPATLKITKANDADNSQTISAVPLNGRYKAEIAFDTTGTYYVTSFIDIGYGQITGNTISLNVGNIAPKPTQDVFEFKERSIKFGSKQFTYDLNEMVTDEDGDKISFAVDKAFFDKDEYAIDKGMLIVAPKEAKEGSFNIIATDEQGAPCEIKLNLIYESLLEFLLKIIIAIVIAAAVAFFVLRYIKYHKSYGGSITVTAFDKDNGDTSSPDSLCPPKGPMDIERVNAVSFTIGGIRGFFYGSGKDFVTFRAKGMAYLHGSQVKEVKIYSGMTEEISSSEDGARGVRIRFSK